MRQIFSKGVCLFVLLGMLQSAYAQSKKVLKEKNALIAEVEKDQEKYADIALKVWGYAEMGYQETKSSALLSSTLEEAGFKIEKGVAGIPTAFVATWGSGEPVIGILGEYDALPGIAQDSTPVKTPIEGQVAGHACGHHLFGAASIAASITIKNWLESTGTSGTIRFYGTPAEEGGAGKVYMVRAGLFDDVDAVLHWHPSSANGASPSSSLANKSAKFRFYGAAAHAAGAPERGRSALDAVEAMNMMVNMMREHVDEKSRIHYVITRGGEAPNVVPAFAEVYYYVRHPQRQEVKDMWERVVKAAEGAALGTETKMEYEVIHGVYNLLPNEILAKKMYNNLVTVGGVHYNDAEIAFAEKVAESFGNKKVPLENAAKISEFKLGGGGAGSTDVGDISWVVPTVGLGTATWVPGTSAHSWQAVAAGGMSIGKKGMIVAAKTLTLTAYDLFTNPEVIEEATKEFEEKTGTDFKYEALLGDREPPLDYRN
ncbi:amidohydrolase [Chondrinema litorale]|uniref:amidohydrolase n=1 Tax=Chondrinema litorale TaxID=2994555 RepID=UPI0025431BFB|nr:amidohydrolase [Chondrinema litorale]UZR92705.1 amidohydrolase [Chondrinema litorale]